MKNHLITIAIMLMIVLLLFLVVRFPEIFGALLISIAFIAIYWVAYTIVKAERAERDE